MNRTLLGTFTILILASLMLYSLALSSWSETVNAGDDAKGFLPVILGDDPLLPPATMIPPTETPTPTQTSTSTPTSTPTMTPTPTMTATPTSTPTDTGEPEPVVKQFLASPAVIKSGQSTMLSWFVDGDYDSVSIQPDVGDVTYLTQVIVSPKETTVYTLSVKYTTSQGQLKKSRKTTVTIGEPGDEVVVFNLNRPVITDDKGFPKITGDEIPADANGDWTVPPNYAEGSLYMRWEIRSQPVPQNMVLQLCMWQKGDDGPFTREQCAARQSIPGESGEIRTAWQLVESMWVKDRLDPINWAEPRYRYAMAIKNEVGCPVTSIPIPEENLPGQCPVGEDGILLKWSGEDPDEWFPLDMCFSVIVVGKDKAFSGWENYTHLCETGSPENFETAD